MFGAIHAGSSDPAFLVPLGLLGMGLCLLYVRTGSLYPCVAAHALNNSIAFGVSQRLGLARSLRADRGGAARRSPAIFAARAADQRSRAPPEPRRP